MFCKKAEFVFSFRLPDIRKAKVENQGRVNQARERRNYCMFCLPNCNVVNLALPFSGVPDISVNVHCKASVNHVLFKGNRLPPDGGPKPEGQEKR